MTEDRAEALHLVEELPEEKLEQVVLYLRSVTQSPKRARKTEPFAWIGAGKATNGRTDNATHVDELLAQGFGRD